MSGIRHDISMTSLTHDSLRGSVLHASTLAVFLLGILGQGFSPCPHHTNLDQSEHVPHGASTGAIAGGMVDEDVTPADSESEHDGDFCSCLNACDVGSGNSFSLGQSPIRPVSFTVLKVAERLDPSLLDTRQNAYLVPLPQPPPHNA